MILYVRYLIIGKFDKEIWLVLCKLVVSVGNVDESIFLEYFFIKDVILEEIEGVYIEVLENVYDKIFEYRLYVNVNVNVY